MKKFLLPLILVVVFLGLTRFAFSDDLPTLTAALDSNTPLSQSLPTNAQYFEVARIKLTASVGDVYINGFYMATDVSGGLSNFANLFVYDDYDDTLVGTYPNQSEFPNLIRLSNYVRIGNGQFKTYIIKASLSSTAAGVVRVGFSGFSFTTQALPTLVEIPIYGNPMTLPGATPTPTPSATLTPSVTPTPAPSSSPTPVSLGFTNLTNLGLKEGNIIGSIDPSDPDIYIVNDYGYRRLFLNPVIFGFYGHLKFSDVKKIPISSSGKLVTSGLFRNCETNDPKVYGVEVTGEDTGRLHWVNTTGAQAVADDPEFFKKVFCINTNEFNWYLKGTDYNSVTQIPIYTR